ncbi:squalene--hopene cyclase [Bacillus sp. 03113]|uniref:squalene--hopene cyclase n=1 Tax=Bacillus sp. 03113 TaxID=2578211 RepID=UPI0011430C4C|nr:squalene--hopene cyclase [Bacillus sp. 03113]
MNRMVEQLKKDQSIDGSWNYPFDTGIATDAYMIILLRTLKINDEELIKELVARILSKQEKNGAWKLFYDEGVGNLSSTIEAYYALLYSGYCTKDDKNIKSAKQFVLSNGGIEKSHFFTKVMLALTGQYSWPNFFPIPIEIVLLPTTFPINFFDISIYGRANLTPILILANNKYKLRTKNSPDLSDLFITRLRSWDEEFVAWNRSIECRSFLNTIHNGIKALIGFPNQLHALAIERAKKYMLERIESDGTFLSYFSSTFLMIFALLSLGYKKKDPIILKAVEGLLTMKCQVNGHTHMQYTTATVWNTSLISYALQEAGVSITDPVVEKANRYLLSRQHVKYGDWIIHNAHSYPGGWGFSNVNTFNPDVDDTTASLRALSQIVNKEPFYYQVWDRGMNWLLSMQNDDGGWSSFEKNVSKKISSFIPIQGAEYLLEDRSSADLTGRSLEFLGKYTRLSKRHFVMKDGVNWLFDHQEKDGSWYGRWGICYLYGTWAAITGLVSAGVSSRHPSIQKSVTWLNAIQNPDGGWGESCKSDIKKKYIPLTSSTLTDTAWAVDTLVSALDKPSQQLEAGIKYIIEASNKEDWTTHYPKGQGMASGFYIHYHSYKYIFPLLALSHYRKKFLIESKP